MVLVTWVVVASLKLAGFSWVKRLGTRKLKFLYAVLAALPCSCHSSVLCQVWT